MTMSQDAVRGALARLSFGFGLVLGAGGCEPLPVDWVPLQGLALQGCALPADIDCSAERGVCQDSLPQCDDVNGWVCVPRPESGYEPVEASCDGLDNDCDGETDELGILSCGLAACQKSVPVCSDGRIQTCDPLAGAVEEVCNGLDDDCDGAVDDGLVSPAATLHKGVCSAAVRLCAGARGWRDPDYDALAGYEETETSCDGHDNDCDGETDETLRRPPASLGAGVCAGLSRSCAGEEGWVDPDFTSVDGYEEVETLCDGRDNDCDGETDEGLVAPPSRLQLGVCTGALAECRGERGWTEPDYGAIAGYELGEVSCDGRDNDCDGETDERLGTLSCGVGACRREIPTCAGGVPTVCDPFAGAADETCDGEDNDCDGEIDELVVAPPASLHEGVCSGLVQVCAGAEGWYDPPYGDVAGFEPRETRCDGLDNDCDGVVDEDFASVRCGLGVCAHSEPGCVGGEEVVCDPFQGAGVETCNDLDDDCDGETDEDLGTLECGLGVCAHGVPSCLDGVAQTCDPLEGAGAEVCNGLDDDCDGASDEDLETLRCGTGVCAHSVPSCRDGVSETCDPFEGAGVEVCNGLDDDCDGASDEGLGTLSCGLGVCAHSVPACAGGRPNACDPEEGASPEICNGLDDDCDGSADEDDVCVTVGCLGPDCAPPDSPTCTTPGSAECSGETLVECDATGHLRSSPCAAGCTDFALGSYCEATTGRLVEGVVRYQARTANAAKSDWGPLFEAPLASALVVSYRADGAGHAIHDVALSGDDGAYRLRLPPEPRAGDLVLVWLVGPDDDGGIAYAVANPAFSATGEHAIQEVFTRADLGSLWSFATPAANIAADPAILISESAYSGVVRSFDHARFVYETTRVMYGRRGNSLLLWMQPDVSWDCGACSARFSNRIGAHQFAAAIWLGYDDDQAYWSDAVTVHELGHWVMSSYGTSPGEGGKHYLGHPTLPGQAWSEGFATFFSSLARGDPFYFDKQRGTFFWIDIGELAYPGRGMLLPTADGAGYPYPDDPVLQLMDENVVAGMAYAIATNRGEQVPTLAEEGRLVLDALASDRLNVRRLDPSAQFLRRYVRHTWRLDEQHDPVDITPVWTSSAPMLADYLDALRCVSAERGLDLDALVAESIQTYPYPIESDPLCTP